MNAVFDPPLFPCSWTSPFRDLAALSAGRAEDRPRESAPSREGPLSGLTAHGGVGGDDDRQHDTPVGVAGVAARLGRHA